MVDINAGLLQWFIYIYIYIFFFIYLFFLIKRTASLVWSEFLATRDKSALGGVVQITPNKVLTNE